MLYRICSVVRREETSPKGDGSIRRYFCGEAAAAEKEAAVAAAADDGEQAAEVGADNGAQRLRFGDAGLSSGSKSRVLFRVAPHAMAGAAEVPGSGGVGRGDGRRGRGKTGLEERLTDGLKSRTAPAGAPVGRGQPPPPPPRQGQWPGPVRARAGGAVSAAHASRIGGALPPPRARIPPGEAPVAPAVRSSSAPCPRRSCAETGTLRKSRPAPGGVRLECDSQNTRVGSEA